MNRHLIAFTLASVASLCAATAHADTVTQWNFNSGTTAPSIGVGSASLVGGVSSSGFNSGVGSSDLNSPNNGWQTTTYAAPSSGDKARGTQYLVDTSGFESIVLSYDLRHSNTSSRYEAVQYTLDGSSWIDAAIFDGNAGDTWFNARTVDLSGVAGAADNDSFGFRVLATFAPNSMNYLASRASSTYGAAGTWRFDMVTVSGSVISAVPEPETYALMLAGLAVVGSMARRRQA